MAEKLSIAILYFAAIVGSLLFQIFNIAGSQVIYPFIPVAVLAILLHKFEDGILLAGITVIAVGILSNALNGDQIIVLAGSAAAGVGIAGLYIGHYKNQNAALNFVISVAIATLAFELSKNFLNAELYILNSEQFLGLSPVIGIHIAGNILIALALTAYLPEAKKEEKK